MKPSAAGRKKRPRDDHLSSDDDGHDSGSENNPERLGQAERKRELERNRRNLINVRFAELDAELRTHAPKPGSLSLSQQQQQAAKTKRIDKEAVLKEATQRLAVHRNDMKSLQERITLNTSEIENLRTEKAELRSDKAYLRSELDNVRGDVQRLRQDNINLWQALRKTSTLKNGLSQDVAKLPADLFLRPRTTTDEVAVNTPSSNNSLPHQTPSPPTLPSHGPHQLNTSGAQPSTTNVNTNEQAASGNRLDPLAQSPCLQNIQPSAEAYLVLQSAEELGQLLSMAAPASSAVPNGSCPMPTPPQHALRTPLHGIAGTQLTSPPINGIPFSMASPSLHSNPGLKEVASHKMNNPTPATANEGDDEANGKLDGEDPLSDIAYCV